MFQTQSAVGTALEQVTATLAYTANGQAYWVQDAAGNYYIDYRFDLTGAMTQALEYGANQLGAFRYDDLGRMAHYQRGRREPGRGADQHSGGATRLHTVKRLPAAS